MILATTEAAAHTLESEHAKKCMIEAVHIAVQDIKGNSGER